MDKNLPAKLTIAVILLASLQSHAGNRAHSDTAASPVTGESWLNHLHRSFGDTSMGKTGRLGPPAVEEEGKRWQLGFLASSDREVQLRGQDLYRLNCQPCHGEKGLGAPPEINSILDPVRATSAPLMLERMKQRGMDISPAAAAEMAKQAQSSLTARLHKGGQSMPAFSQLNEIEMRALIEYLKELSGTPGARQSAVTVAPVRVGELIVKSTCHICHDAAGANPTPAQLEDGAIPPLDALTSRTDEVQLIRKVTSGAPVVMGTPPTLHRGRMPVFYYLTREEAADVYLYLSDYPPSQLNAEIPTAQAIAQDRGKDETPPAAPPSKPSTTPSTAGVPAFSQQHVVSVANWAMALALLTVVSFALTLLMFGCSYGSYRLSQPGRPAFYSGGAALPVPSKPMSPFSVAGNLRRT